MHSHSTFTRVALLLFAAVALSFAGCKKDKTEPAPKITSITPSPVNFGETVTITGENFGSSTADVIVLFRPTGIATLTEVQKRAMVSFDGQYFYAYTPTAVTSTTIGVAPSFCEGDIEVRVIVKDQVAVAPSLIDIYSLCL